MIIAHLVIKKFRLNFRKIRPWKLFNWKIGLLDLLAMENQLVRLCILVVLVFLLTSDIKDLLEALSTTSTVGPYLTNWKSVPGPGEAQKRNSQHVSESYKRKFSNRRKRRENYLQEQEKQLEGSGEEQYLEDDEPVKFYTPIPTGRTSKTSKSQKKLNKVNPDNLFASLSGIIIV